MSIPAGNYSLQGGAGGAAGPSTASAATYGSGLDASGWNINFSGAQSASSTQDKSGGGVPGVGGGSGILSQSGLLTVAAALAVGLIVWRLKR